MDVPNAQITSVQFNWSRFVQPLAMNQRALVLVATLQHHLLSRGKCDENLCKIDCESEQFSGRENASNTTMPMTAQLGQSRFMSNRHWVGSRGPLPGSLDATTQSTSLIKVSSLCCPAMDWPSRVIFQPGLYNNLQRDSRSITMRKICPKHLNLLCFSIRSKG